jgi:hypothetical protein
VCEQERCRKPTSDPGVRGGWMSGVGCRVQGAGCRVEGVCSGDTHTWLEAGEPLGHDPLGVDLNKELERSGHRIGADWRVGSDGLVPLFVEALHLQARRNRQV